MRVTQRQIAAAAGVSLSTVSLVFSGSRKIPAATATRVRAVAAEMGYRPSPGLSAVQRARWRESRPTGYSRLALVRTGDAAQQHYLQAVRTGSKRLFARQAAELGYDLEVLDIAEASPAKVRDRLSFLRIDGIVFPMVTKVDAAIEAVLADWPCVGMFTQTRRAGFPVVAPDELMGGYRVLEELAAQGCRRPLFVVQRFPATRGVIGRLGGLLAAQAIHCQAKPLPVCWIEPGRPEQALKRLTRRDYDAVIVENASILSSLEAEAPQLSEVPRAVLQLADDDTSHAGIRNDPQLLHAQVLRLLDTMIRGSITGAQLRDLRQSVAFP